MFRPHTPTISRPVSNYSTLSDRAMSVHSINRKTFVRPREHIAINLDHISTIELRRDQITFYSPKTAGDFSLTKWRYHYSDPEEASFVYHDLLNNMTKRIDQ